MSCLTGEEVKGEKRSFLDGNGTNCKASRKRRIDSSVREPQSIEQRRTDEGDQNNRDDDSVTSIHQKHGVWGETDLEDVPWCGCVCGEIHGRPVPVFWMQCDGPCRAWYNVTSPCVNGWTLEDAKAREWYCPTCTRRLEQPQQTEELLALWNRTPSEVWFRFLEYAAPSTFRATVLIHQLAPLCHASHFLFCAKSRGLWELLLQNDYYIKSLPRKIGTSQASRRSPRRAKRAKLFIQSHQYVDENVHPIHLVQEAHILLLHRTEDAYHAIEELANAGNRSDLNIVRHSVAGLTLARLRDVLQRYAPINVNRPSTRTGRTLLQVICAGDLSERVVVSCVQHVLELGGDPNIYSKHEEPFTCRPTIYFAISRVMPQLLSTLIQAGGRTDVKVKGQFRMTFDTTKIVSGTFTPLDFAMAIKRLEVEDTSRTRVPFYWVNNLNACIRILECAGAPFGERRPAK